MMNLTYNQKSEICHACQECEEDGTLRPALGCALIATVEEVVGQAVDQAKKDVLAPLVEIIRTETDLGTFSDKVTAYVGGARKSLMPQQQNPDRIPIKEWWAE